MHDVSKWKTRARRESDKNRSSRYENKHFSQNKWVEYFNKDTKRNRITSAKKSARHPWEWKWILLIGIGIRRRRRRKQYHEWAKYHRMYTPRFSSNTLFVLRCDTFPRCVDDRVPFNVTENFSSGKDTNRRRNFYRDDVEQNNQIECLINTNSHSTTGPKNFLVSIHVRVLSVGCSSFYRWSSWNRWIKALAKNSTQSVIITSKQTYRRNNKSDYFGYTEWVWDIQSKSARTMKAAIFPPKKSKVARTSQNICM